MENKHTKKLEGAFYFKKQTNEIHQTNREAECRRNHCGWGQLGYVSSLCYKLILIWLLGAIELFIKSSEWRNPKEIGTWQQGHPSTRRRDYTCLGGSPSAWPSTRGETPEEIRGWLSLPPLSTAHSQGEFKLSQRPLISEPQFWHRTETQIWEWSLDSQLVCFTEKVLMSVGLTHSMAPPAPTERHDPAGLSGPWFTAGCKWWIKGHGRNAGEKSGRRGKQGECLGADTQMGKKR